MDRRHNPALHRFAQLTAGATFLLLLAGGLVTSNDAGLAVPDWPLSYGTWMPPLVGNILYEHGHRMVATFVGMLTVVLVGWLLLKEPRRWVRRVGLVALAVVALQGVLGGITVLFLLPRPVSIAHASLAQIFFCLAVSLAVFTGPRWQEEKPKRMDEGAPALRRLAQLSTAALFLQLVLGAAFRHDAVGLAPHLADATLVALLVSWTVKRAWRAPSEFAELRGMAVLLASLLLLQLALGGATYFARLANAEAAQPLPVFVVLTVAHLGVGALLLASSMVLTLYAHRRLSPAKRPFRLTETHKATV